MIRKNRIVPFVFAGWIAAGASSSAQETVTIPDRALEVAIRSALELEEGPILEQHMVSLTQLDVDELDISDLSGLESAVNLEVLELGDNDIVDLSPLAGLSKLSDLSLYGNEIADVAALQNLENLESLNLWGNRVADLDPLRNLKALRNLRLGSNSIQDTKPIVDLNQLESLDFSNNPIVDPTFPASPDLKHLDVEGLGIALIEFSYVNLESLDVSDNLLRSIGALPALPELRVLRLRRNQVGSLEGIGERFPMLELLDLDFNQVENLAPLADLEFLSSLALAYNPVSDLSAIEGLAQLGSLRLWSAPVTNIAPLRDLPNLKGVSFENGFLDLSDGSETSGAVAEMRARGVTVTATGQRDITRVEVFDPALRSYLERRLGVEGRGLTNLDMAKLAEIDVEDAHVSDLTGLEHAINLKELDLEENDIEDVGPLRDLRNLRYIDLCANRIADLSPLEDMIHLRVADLGDNQIEDLSPIRRWRVRFLDLESNRIRSLEPLRSLGRYLRSLEVEENPLEGIDPVADLVLLQQLIAIDTGITSIEPLRGLEHLSALYLQRNFIRDLSPLRGMTQLVNVGLSENNVSDISPLVDLTAAVAVELNLLDLEPGSSDLADVRSIEHQRRRITYEPQLPSEEIGPVALRIVWPNPGYFLAEWETKAGEFYLVESSSDLAHWRKGRIRRGNGKPANEVFPRPSRARVGFLRVSRFLDD